MSKYLLVLVGLLCVEQTLAQSVIHVPEDYLTIQAAINAAQPGDKVYISPGWYVENLVITKPIELIGAGRSSTFIRAHDPTHPVVLVEIEEGEVVVEGLCIRRGEAGILYQGHGALKVWGCTLAENGSAGIAAFGQALKLEGVFLYDNAMGLLLGSLSGSAELMTCDLVENLLAGIVLMTGGVVTITDCTVGLGGFGVEVASQECGWEEEPGEGTRLAGLVEVRGEGNRVHSVVRAFCPSGPGAPWPAGFHDLGWAEIVSQVVELHDRDSAL